MNAPGTVPSSALVSRQTPAPKGPGSRASKGDVVVYRSLANLGDHLAEVVHVRPDGSLDIAVDAGAGDPLELSRIALLDALAPGCCSLRFDGGPA